LTVVELTSVVTDGLHVTGVDLLDQTPIVDVKPYIPRVDAFPASRAGFVDLLDQAPDPPLPTPRIRGNEE